MNQLQATVTGSATRPFITRFNESSLERIRQKYQDQGLTFTLNGVAGALQPAAEGIAKPVHQSQEVTKREKSKRVTKERPPVASEPLKTGRGYNVMKAVVNVTTGTYYDCVLDAAFAIGATQTNVSQVLRGAIKATKKNVFRYATEEEKAVRGIITKPE